MGLSTTLANALSGLTAASRGAEVVSQNVANAATPAYARRSLDLSPLSLGGNGAGVQVDGISRQVDLALLGDRRLADAETGGSGLRAGFLAAAERLLGAADDAASLSGLVGGFDAALLTAAGRPDSQAALQAVLTSGQDLAAAFGRMTRTTQAARMQADSGAAADVARLNAALASVDTLNADILAMRAAGRDATALMDQRQKLVDDIATIVPIREVARDHDQVALFTAGGAILLEGNPAVVGFAAVGTITADMTLASGALSGLTINGQPVPATDPGVLGGGSLGARLAIRDGLAVDLQAQLDAFARDLMARFADPAVDPTLAPGAPGLFTDRGAAFDPLAEAGLAGRLAIHAAADPARGGALWHLRDGLSAATQGDVGDGRLIGRMRDALAAERPPASGAFTTLSRSAGGLTGDILSRVAGQRLSAEAGETRARARQSALTELQLRDGVDTDAELQGLLLIEQAFAANARVIQTVDDLINKLVGL